MALKDTKLEEKEQLVVRGTILADEYRDRKSGKLISGEGGGSETNAIVHDFVEGTILTDEILSQVKSGDIIKVANMEFVVNNKVNQSPRSITGKIIGAISGDTLTIVELNWINGQALSPTMKNFDISDEFDRDVTIQIATSGDSTFGDPITYEEWAEASKEKEYEVGTIIKFNNLYKGQSYRLIATDLTHGEGTEWQFYDMPMKEVHLGLPFDFQDCGDGGPSALQGYLDGDEEYTYPSNKHGYTSAVELQNALNHLFESLPYKLKRDIRLTEVQTYIPRTCVTDDYGPLKDYSTGDWVENEGPDALGYSKTKQHLYCLSAAEVGYEGQDFPTTVTWNDGEEDQTIAVDGVKHDFFEVGNSGTALTKRIRYCENEVWYYWLRSPYLSLSIDWGFVSYGGGVGSNDTSGYFGLAPAFRV